MGIGFRELLVGLVVLLIIVPIYFAPTIVARRRGHKDRTAIFVLNLFGGWLFLPWLAALVWAYKSQN